MGIRERPLPAGSSLPQETPAGSFYRLYNSHHPVVERAQLGGFNVIRPNMIPSYLVLGLTSLPLFFVDIGESWLEYVRGAWPVEGVVAALAFALACAFVLWVVLCGHQNYGILLELDALYVLRRKRSYRKLAVVRVLWEDLLIAELTGGVGRTATLYTHGPSVELSLREGRALLTDPRYAQIHEIRSDVRDWLSR